MAKIRRKTQKQIGEQVGRIQDRLVSLYNGGKMGFLRANALYNRALNAGNRYTMNIARAQGHGDNFDKTDAYKPMTRNQYMGLNNG